MEIPKEMKITINLKVFLRQEKINEIQYKLDRKAYKKIIKFCKEMAKLGYDFDLIIDDNMLYYRNGELVKSEKK